MEITDESELMVNKNTVMEDNIFYTTPAYDSEVEYPLALKEDQYFILCRQQGRTKGQHVFGVVDTSEIKEKSLQSTPFGYSEVSTGQ